MEKGRLFIVSAPSGAGKSTLCSRVLRRFPEIVYSVSHTTRKPRQGEKDGADYFFISREEFEERIRRDEWAEWAEVHGSYYGTSARILREHLSRGRPVLLDIDVAGTRQILEKFPESITIFIMPPSMEELRRRLEKRGADDRETVEKRIRAAEDEIASRGMYQHVIVNERLDDAVEEFCSIIERYQA